MSRINSIDDIQKMRDSLGTYYHEVQEGKNDVDTVLNSYMNDPTVVSLFESGNFGKEEENKLLNVKNALAEFEEQVCSGEDGLYQRTNRYLVEQESRLTNGHS